MSSKRNLRRTKCERKVKFPTKEDAVRRGRQIQRMGGDFLRAYECPHCKQFHLGHEPGSRQQHASAAVTTF